MNINYIILYIYTMSLYSRIDQIDPYIKLIILNTIDSIQNKYDLLLQRNKLLEKQNKDLIDRILKKEMDEKKELIEKRKETV